VWGKADGDPYDFFDSENSNEPQSAPPARLRARIGASLVIVALLGATARGGWLMFAGPTPVSTPRAVPKPVPTPVPTPIPQPKLVLNNNAENGSSGQTKRMPSVAFVVRCRFSHEATDDPILFPGKPGASHRHSFFGNRATDSSSTGSSLLAGATSCDEPGDAAAYWLPSPLGAKWTSIQAYYSAGQLSPNSISSYPNGIALIGGHPPNHHHNMTHHNMTPEVSAQPPTKPSAMWSCGRSIDEPGWTQTVPTCPKSQTIFARIAFGQCASASKTGQIQTSTTDPTEAGVCPPSHPIGIPQLRIRAELIGTPSALSSGPLTSLHADFMNGWNPEALKQLIDICIRGQRTADEIKRCGLPGTGPRVNGFGTKG
jgi:Domain of unknown function (DUF1996)